MKKFRLVLCVALLIGVMTGCTDYAEEYDKNTIVVKSNGTVVEIAVEDFSDSSVKAMDLTAYIEKQIDTYNIEQDDEVIKNVELLTEDMSKVKLVLQYDDIASYNGFNRLDCVLTDFSEMKESELKGSFTSATGDSVKASKMEDTKKAKVLIMTEATDVVVDGDILYYNKQVKVKDGVATTTGEDKAIIIFK